MKAFFGLAEPSRVVPDFVTGIAVTLKPKCSITNGILGKIVNAILGYLKSIFQVLTVDGVGGGISGTTNPIEPTERAFDRWHLRLHFCKESVVSQCLC